MNHDNAHCLDYIKREDAINVFDWGMPDADVKCGIAIQNIKDIPSSDVVEVVRCKDCKYYNTYESHEKINDGDKLYDGWCMRWSGIEDMNDDDFCSYGERADT